VQTVERNHLGGISRYSTKYDFIGNILASHEQHKVSHTTQVYDTKLSLFEYDHRCRLLKETTTINNNIYEAAVVEYQYNELGQLVSKSYGNGAVTDSLKYNIQGWLTNQNSELFDMQLKYYDPRAGITPSYTGNITEWVWQQKGDMPQAINSYGFEYDKLGRLKGYDHLIGGVSTTSFTEQGINYDANGNIQYLARYDGINPYLPQDYRYFYEGNKLTQICGTHMGMYFPIGTEYTYDFNGNMTFDGMNGVSMEYNSLNLISKVSQGNSANATYRWVADGGKAGVTDNSGNGFEYLGSFVYQRDANGLSLESIGFGAGRFVAASNGLSYSLTPYYQITDHLGSVRAMFSVNVTVMYPQGRPPIYLYVTNVVAQNDYYAFGLKHSNSNLFNHTANRYLFNGKEYQSTGSVNLLDYGARMYDPVTGRWRNPDPLASKYSGISPYAYCVNNPVYYIDPNGKSILLWMLIGGAILGGYFGGVASNDGNYNPLKWDWSSGNTWGGILGGAFQGALMALSIYAGLGTLGLLPEGAAGAGWLAFSSSKLWSWSTLGRAAIFLNGASYATGLAFVAVGLFVNAENAGKIMMGNFYYNPRRSLLGQIWEGFSRGTWETFQQALGTMIAQFRNMCGWVDSVEFYDGAVLVNNNDNDNYSWGFTLGNTINSHQISGTSDPMFMHEYGHIQQSKLLGPFYLGVVAIPSAISSNFSSTFEEHDYRWYEMWANRYARDYFKRFHGIDWSIIQQENTFLNGKTKYPTHK
jgi:RHS repeat-associated protein